MSKEAVGNSSDILNASWVIFIIRITQTQSYEANKATRSSKNEFYHICVIQYTYAAPLAFDLDLVCKKRRARFLSADVGKTFDRTLTTRLLQAVIKLTFGGQFWDHLLDRNILN